MDILTLDQELRSDKIRPGYLIVGPERHLALTAKQHILKSVFKGEEPSPDLFWASKTKIGAILDSFKTHSLFAKWRAVVVEEEGEWKKKEWEAIQKIFLKPAPNATMIILAESVTAAVLGKFPSAVGVVECKKLYPRQVAGWIGMEVRGLGLNISQEAASVLVDCVGTDLGELHHTLEMLSLYVGNRRLVQLEDVEAVAAKTAQKSIFEMTNAVGSKNRVEAAKFLSAILDQGEEPLKILSLIARHFRLLAQAQEILAESRGGFPPDFAKRLGVHPFFAKDYAAQTKHWKPNEWGECFEALFTCDTQLKSSRHEPGAVLGKLIRDLCG